MGLVLGDFYFICFTISNNDYGDETRVPILHSILDLPVSSSCSFLPDSYLVSMVFGLITLFLLCEEYIPGDDFMVFSGSSTESQCSPFRYCSYPLNGTEFLIMGGVGMFESCCLIYGEYTCNLFTYYYYLCNMAVPLSILSLSLSNKMSFSFKN